MQFLSSLVVDVVGRVGDDVVTTTTFDDERRPTTDTQRAITTIVSRGTIIMSPYLRCLWHRNTTDKRAPIIRPSIIFVVAENGCGGCRGRLNTARLIINIAGLIMEASNETPG